MYAIFQEGAHQYRVSEGELVTVELHEGEPGSKLEFNHVLLVQSNAGTKIGQPYVAGAKIQATIVDHPSDKVVVQKFRRRKRYVRRKGHRQHYTSVTIDRIVEG